MSNHTLKPSLAPHHRFIWFMLLCLALWSSLLIARKVTAQASGANALVNTAAVDCNVQSEQTSPSLPGLPSKVKMLCDKQERTLQANGIPDHLVGRFPNAGNPNRISEQSVRFSMPLTPKLHNPKGLKVHVPGFARNGVMLEPETAEVFNWANDGWRYEAIQTVYNLGLDMNLAHVQPQGAYHYHGIPDEYLNALNKGEAMTLVAWASDGFPIYARYGYQDPMDANSGIKSVKPKYRLKTPAELSATVVNGQPRPGFTDGELRRRTQVLSLPQGVFVQDWVFDMNLVGDLDECNGRFGVTPEFPKGIYHYYLTDDYPYMQRCIKGDGKDARPIPTGAMRGGPGGPGGPGGSPGPGGPGGPGRPPPRDQV